MVYLHACSNEEWMGRKYIWWWWMEDCFTGFVAVLLECSTVQLSNTCHPFSRCHYLYFPSHWRHTIRNSFQSQPIYYLYTRLSFFSLSCQYYDCVWSKEFDWMACHSTAATLACTFLPQLNITAFTTALAVLNQYRLLGQPFFGWTADSQYIEVSYLV